MYFYISVICKCLFIYPLITFPNVNLLNYLIYFLNLRRLIIYIDIYFSLSLFYLHNLNFLLNDYSVL